MFVTTYLVDNRGREVVAQIRYTAKKSEIDNCKADKEAEKAVDR